MKIKTFEEVETFVLDHEQEIMSHVSGESDGWNQKIDALNKVMKRRKVEFELDNSDYDKYEELINNLG